MTLQVELFAEHCSGIRQKKISLFCTFNYIRGILKKTTNGIYSLILVFVLLAGNCSVAQKIIDKLHNKNLRFIVNPIAQSNPETGFKFGIAVNYYFKISKDSSIRSSNAFMQIGYTTKRQFIMEPFWNIFTNKEKYIIRGRAGYLDFFDYYWGIGSNTSLSERESLRYKRIYFQNRILKKVKSNWYAGGLFRYSSIEDIKWDGDAPIVLGALESNVLGIGPNLQADFRDNQFSPQKGWYADFYWLYFSKWNARFSEFNEMQVDIRRYIPLKQKYQILAFQAFGLFTHGAVPFRELPRLGSGSIMRGYFEGRFRDYNYMAMQAELRQPIWKLIHGSAFVSFGEVGPQLNKFSVNNLKSAAGVGLRILFNKKENLFARFDFAWNNEGQTNFYIRVNEAF